MPSLTRQQLAGERASGWCARTRRARLSAGLIALAAVTMPPEAIATPNMVAAVGDNSYGQLGIGVDTWTPAPALIGNVVAVAAGDGHTVFLKADGTVWASGAGQLGMQPMRVPNLSGVRMIAAGYSHSLALKNDGTVWAWGSNSYGQLGDGTWTARTQPVQVLNLSGVTAVAGNGYHSLALRNDGTVWGWGSNYDGQLGDGTSGSSRSQAAQMLNFSGGRAIAAGLAHSLVIKNDGTLWACGANASGQLGDGSTVNRKQLVQVANLSGVTTAAGGGFHSLALRDDGTVWAWGQNTFGELGDGTTDERTLPVQVLNLAGATAISAGEFSSMALTEDGTAWAWGYPNHDRLECWSVVPLPSPVVSGANAIAAGPYHGIIVKDDGSVWGWGVNESGQLGQGITSGRSRAVQSDTFSGVTAIAAGDRHSLARKEGGAVWAWGFNWSGQLGDGTTATRTQPVQVLNLSQVTAVTGGYGHSLALKDDGTVRAWGRNTSGQLGDGTTTQRTQPVQVLNLSGITAIAAGSSHNLALRNDGTVWAWGTNYSGQLGDGTTTQRTQPVQVLNLSGVTAIAAGTEHSLAVKNDGTAWAWGADGYGQLGDGRATGWRVQPFQVMNITGVTAIAGGDRHSLALRSDGIAWAWGDNSHGQLAYDTITPRTQPVQVLNLTGVTAIAAGAFHSLGLRNDGTAWAWGANSRGALGDGTVTDRRRPVQVVGLSSVTQFSSHGYHNLFLGPSESSPPGIPGTWPSDGSTAYQVRYVVVAFDDPVLNVSADDLVLSGGAVTGVTGNGSGPYSFEITGAPVGPITATIAGDITDVVGNPLPAYQWTFINELPRTAAQWRSLRSHSGIGELAIVLDSARSGNGASGPNVEARGTAAAGMGVQKVEVDFDQPVTLVDPAGVGVTYWVTAAGVMGPAQSYLLAPGDVSMLDTDTMEIALSSFPDAACGRITIAPGTLAEVITGDMDCMVRSLVADGNGDGSVNLADALLAKNKVGQGAASWPYLDFNLSGGITLADALMAKSRIGKAALCP